MNGEIVEIDVVAIGISIASLLGVIIGPIISNLVEVFQAQAERRERRQYEYEQYLIERLDKLIELRSETATHNPRVVREARAIMLTLGDREIEEAATNIDENASTDELLDSFDFVLIRLSELIAEERSGKKKKKRRR